MRNLIITAPNLASNFKKLTPLDFLLNGKIQFTSKTIKSFNSRDE
jgi:hypothetical protein